MDTVRSFLILTEDEEPDSSQLVGDKVRMQLNQEAIVKTVRVPTLQQSGNLPKVPFSGVGLPRLSPTVKKLIADRDGTCTHGHQWGERVETALNKVPMYGLTTINEVQSKYTQWYTFAFCFNIHFV